MQYPSYEKHQLAGLEWAGTYPAHWSIKRFKFLLKDGYEGLKIGPFGSQIKSEDLANEGYKVYGQENVINRNFEVGNRYLDEEKFQELRVYEIFPGDLLITMMGTSGKCEIAPSDLKQGIMDSHLIRLRTNGDLLAEFARYLIDQSDYVEYQIQQLGKGSIMHGLNSTVIKNLEFLLPPIDEQYSIVKFLDYKTQQIDQLIENKKALIEKLNEQRIAVITQAVTKGLNKNAKMKPSGVDWLGDVPEHWEVMHLSHAVRMKSGESITSLDIMPFGTYPVYGGNGIRGYFEEFTHDGDYVLIGRQGALCGNIKLVSGKIWASEHAVVVTLDRILNIEWLAFLLETMNLNQYSVSAAQPGLSVEAISRLKIPFPLKEEQDEIVRKIKNSIQRIDKMILVSIRALEIFKEYRVALITDAVTGKIDVRNVKI